VRKALAYVLLALLGSGILAGLMVVALQAWTARRYEPMIFAHVEAVPIRPAAIVFGAGYWPSGRLSNILMDRMDTAIALYEGGKVHKLLLTGDNRVVDYNEPQRAGRRTYDSCYRARAIFGLQEAVLVSQAYHLPRALFTCSRLGLDVVGIGADRRQYVYQRWYRLRELLALGRAWLDVTVLKPLPVLGDPFTVDWEHEFGG